MYNRLAGLRQQEYDLRRQTLEEMIAERAGGHGGHETRDLGRRRCSSRKWTRRPRCRTRRSSTPSTSRTSRASADAPKKEAIARIREILTQRARGRARGRSSRRTCGTPPASACGSKPPRIDVTIPAGAPATGPNNAPVTIVEFTDYQCPYCHRAQNAMDKMLARTRARCGSSTATSRSTSTPEAFPAARAARCAGEQGKFWEYHKSLMSVRATWPRPTSRAAPRRLKLEQRQLQDLPGLRPPRRGDPAGAGAGTELGVTGHARLLHQRPDARRAPSPSSSSSR